MRATCRDDGGLAGRSKMSDIERGVNATRPVGVGPVGVGPVGVGPVGVGPVGGLALSGLKAPRCAG